MAKHKLPSKGRSLELVNHEAGTRLVIRKCASGRDWFAKVEGQTRCRFGNAREIREDIDHFLLTGNLPSAKAGLY